MRISLVLGAVALCAVVSSGTARAQAAAEVVLLVGKGEKRATEPAPWTPVGLNEKVPAGGFVRTLVNSQMGLYLPDRTQIRLNQNSQLQIKTIADSAQFTETSLRLNAGRAWSQAKPQAAPAGANPAQARVNIQTPTATMGVRGTDWEIEVGPDGETQLVVLSGVVDIANELGMLSVNAGEAAVARAGSAPVRLTLVNPSSRVQWVSSWKPNPRRWAGADASRHAPAISAIEAGDYAAAVARLRPLAAQDPAAAVLLADVLMHQGDLAGAIASLQPHQGVPIAGERASALLARALARDDKLAQGRAVAGAALARQPASVELLLAQGELASLDGDAAGARAAFAKALAADPRNAEAWHGVGLIESEREHVRQARLALREALRTDPNHSRATAELAATEIFAGNLPEARTLLESLLAREPDNYVALTSLGTYKLRAGQPAAALDDFLKAGLVEPRYARAWLYTGVAHYQLGDTPRALEAFDKAAQLDPRDPVPHVFESIVHGDRLAYGAAIEAARDAQQRMPFLKSLNQVSSDQKGSANLGSALANFGLEEWAGFYAAEAMSPYWGGSHLFLADRYTGKFNRNSELFQGFLTDPLAFGAPPRRSSLVAVPGHYGRVEALVDSRDWRQGAVIGTLNGMSAAPSPIAYFLSGDLAGGDARNDDSSVNARSTTLGLGTRPRHDVGLFAFATQTRMRSHVRAATLPDDRLLQSESRLDFGANFKLAPDNQFWLKAGGGAQDSRMRGAIVSVATANALNAVFGPGAINPIGTLDSFYADIHQRDLQFRHAFDARGTQWSWGFEHSRQRREGDLLFTLAPIQTGSEESFAQRSRDLWVSARRRFESGHELQADLFRQRLRIEREDRARLQVVGAPAPLVATSAAALAGSSEWNPRIGARIGIAPQQALRIVLQEWRRPASVGTLSPVDTVGIPVNDRLPAPGGLYRRARIQFDGELAASTFAQVFGDHEQVGNGLAGRRSPVSDFQLTQLEDLRNRPDIFSARSDLEETPRFTEGRISSVGFAVNHLVSRDFSVAARYLHREARQTGALNGLRVPWVPADYVQLGAQWALPGQWLVGTSAIYRTSRFRDDTNRVRVDGGWAFGLTAYWETADKRHSLQAIADNLLSRKSAGRSGEAHLALRYSYNFDWMVVGNK